MQNLKVLRNFAQIDIFKETQEPLDQQFLIKAVLENNHFKDYPPAQTFERSFWKWVIKTIETVGEEVDERIYHRYMALLPPPSEPGTTFDRQLAPSSSYTTYLLEPPPESKDLLESVVPSPFASEWPGVLSITMMESRKTFEQGTTGLRTWQPGLIFADWLLRNPIMARGRVLELGCGAGLTAIVTASIQKALSRQGVKSLSLCLTDIDEGVISACKRNVNLQVSEYVTSNLTRGVKALQVDQLNGGAEASWRLLDWNDAVPGESRESLLRTLREINPSIVFGTDLVYDVTLIPGLAYTLSALVFELPEPPEIIMTITLRRQATIDTFLESIGRLGLSARMHDLPPLEETVFAKRNDVDKEAVIKLIRIGRTPNS